MNILEYIKNKRYNITFQNQELLESHSFKERYETNTYTIFKCEECDLCVVLDFSYANQIPMFETCEAIKMQKALQ